MINGRWVRIPALLPFALLSYLLCPTPIHHIITAAIAAIAIAATVAEGLKPAQIATLAAAVAATGALTAAAAGWEGSAAACAGFGRLGAVAAEFGGPSAAGSSNCALASAFEKAATAATASAVATAGQRRAPRYRRGAARATTADFCVWHFGQYSAAAAGPGFGCFELWQPFVS